MKAPMPQPDRQPFAQGPWPAANGFAMAGAARHCADVGRWMPSRGVYGSARKTPSPSLRSGLFQAGPRLWAGHCPGIASRVKNCFEIRDIAVESGAITTNSRGSFPCASRLSSSPYFSRPSPAACRTPRRAGWPVPPLAPWSLTQPRVTFLPAQSSAGLPVSRPAGSRSACRLATPATERLNDRSACGRTQLTKGTIRADRPGGPLL